MQNTLDLVSPSKKNVKPWVLLLSKLKKLNPLPTTKPWVQRNELHPTFKIEKKNNKLKFQLLLTLKFHTLWKTRAWHPWEKETKLTMRIVKRNLERFNFRNLASFGSTKRKNIINLLRTKVTIKESDSYG